MPASRLLAGWTRQKAGPRPELAAPQKPKSGTVSKTMRHYPHGRGSDQSRARQQAVKTMACSAQAVENR